MTRLLPSIPLLMLVAALLVPASAATAAPPSSVDSQTEEFLAGDACAFPISVTYTGKSGFNELPHNPQFAAISTSPGLKATVTNLVTGNAVTVNATGAFRYVPQPDGSLIIRAGGHNLLYGAPGIGATALATSGPVTLRVSPEGEFVGADVSGARVRDLCAELA